MAGSQTVSASTVNVQAGDTVWGFSQTHHVSTQDIVKANRLADANLIYINQKLTIPDGAKTTSAHATSGTTTAPQTGTTSSAAKSATTSQATKHAQKQTANTSSTKPAKHQATSQATSSSASHAATTGSTGSTTDNAQSSTPATTPATTGTTASSSSTGSYAHSTSTTPTTNSSSTTSSTTTTGATTTPATSSSSTTATTGVTGGNGVATALKVANSNVPYVYGGSSLSGFDCSGLVQYAFGLSARTTYQQTKLGTHHYDVANAPAGAILFWGSESAPYHDGISLGNGQYVAAQNPSDGIGTFSQQYWQPSYYIVL